MAERDEEKTEQATPKKRREAMEEGNIAKSRELPAALIFFITTIFFYYYIPTIWDGLKKFFYEAFQVSHYSFNIDSTYFAFILFLGKTLILLSPFIGLILLLSILGNVLQFGFIITSKAIEPKWERLNPVKGLQNLFSKRTFVELIKSLIKTIVVGLVAYFIVKGKVLEIINLTDADPVFTINYMGLLIFKISLGVGILILFMALLDYGYQKWQHEVDLRMTRSELKEELKQMEGDPLIRQRIRNIQREIARRRMMEEVKGADVVVTNPTHYAVALKYKQDVDRAPKVVAKGQNLIALRIIEIARLNNISIYEDPPLARLLFSTIDIDGEIPENLYKAVAEILAFVYNVNKGKVNG